MIEVFRDLRANVLRLFGVDTLVDFPGEVKAGPNLKEMKKLNVRV